MTHVDPDQQRDLDYQREIDHLLEHLDDEHTALVEAQAQVKALEAERDLFRNLAAASADVVEAARLATAEFRASPVDELGLAVRLTRLFNALDRLPKESA